MQNNDEHKKESGPSHVEIVPSSDDESEDGEQPVGVDGEDGGNDFDPDPQQPTGPRRSRREAGVEEEESIILALSQKKNRPKKAKQSNSCYSVHLTRLSEKIEPKKTAEKIRRAEEKIQFQVAGKLTV